MTDEVTGSETFSRSALIEDLRTLASSIESLHADPYRGYGGKIAFHRQLEQLVEDMPAAATTAEFHEHVSPLLMGMKDGHTKLAPPGEDTDDRQLPISLRVIGEDLFVDAVYDDANVDILGSRLDRVAGVPVEELLDRQTLRAAENRYGERYQLADRLGNYERLQRLLDRDENPSPLHVTVERTGSLIERALEPIPEDSNPTETLSETVETPTGTGPRFRFYEDGAGAVFVPGDLQGFRESFEVMQARGADQVEEVAEAAYERHVGGDPPTDRAELIAALPSMVETLVDLVTEMDAHGTETLVIDLRDNPGGDSTFVYYIAYFLYGWEGLAQAAESVTAIKRRTPRHREKYGSPGADQPSTAERNPADYDFGAALKLQDPDLDVVIDHLRETLSLSDTFTSVAADEYGGYYEPPNLVVLVSAGTFSSGFAGVAQLSTLGATVVGVPSGQSPVSYGEAVELSLPNTGLTASIAGAAYEWVAEPEGTVLVPDRELTAGEFGNFNHADDAILRLAFDYLGLTDGDPPEPV